MFWWLMCKIKHQDDDVWIFLFYFFVRDRDLKHF